MNLYITDSAKREFDAILAQEGNEHKLIRFYIKRVSRWYGPIIGVVLDEPGENDKVYEVEGNRIIINSSLENQIKNIYVDYIKDGYHIGYKIDCN